MKCFISDYDGTYLRPCLERSRQLEANAQAVNRWREAGGYFGFSTGRILPLIEKELKDPKLLVDFMIVANGALVLDEVGQVIFHQQFEPDMTQAIIHYLTVQTSLDFICSDGKDGYHTPRVLQPSSSMHHVFQQLKETGLFQLSLEEITTRGISQFSIVDLTPEQVGQITAELEFLFENQVTVYPNRSSIDLSPIGISKAVGIQKVVQHYQLKPEEVICMGDSWNDVEMIQDYQGLTVPEAPVVLKESAVGWFQTVEEALAWATDQKRLRD